MIAAAALASTTNLVTIVALAFAVIAALGAAFAVFKGNMAKATIEMAEKNSNSLVLRVELLEKDNAAKDRIIETQGEQIRALQGFVSGTDAIKVLTVKIDLNQKQLLDAIKARDIKPL